MRHAQILGLCCLLALPARAQDAADVAPLASALTKLSRALDAAAHAPRHAALDGQGLLDVVRTRDPVLMKAFAGNVVWARRDGGDSIVLVCDAGGRQALLEDAGCTAPLDVQHWQGFRQCAFTLDPAAVCR